MGIQSPSLKTQYNLSFAIDGNDNIFISASNPVETHRLKIPYVSFIERAFTLKKFANIQEVGTFLDSAIKGNYYDIFLERGKVTVHFTVKNMIYISVGELIFYLGKENKNVTAEQLSDSVNFLEDKVMTLENELRVMKETIANLDSNIKKVKSSVKK